MTLDEAYIGELRKQAERRLRGRIEDPQAVPSEQLPQIAHELNVHQIELEMQNEELRRSYRDLEEARCRYADLFELGPLGYFILDDTGKILQANIAGAHLLGVEQVSLVGNRLQHYVTEASGYALHLHLRSVCRSGVKTDCELELKRNDGTHFFAQLSSVALSNQHVERAECLTIVNDISEQKSAAEMMQKAQEATAQASAAKTRFLAAASHDIRQPLQALTAIGELLRPQLHAPEQRELLDFHTEALTSMRDLLDALLDVSRLDAGTITPNVQSLWLAPLLQKVESQHKLLAQDKGLRLRVAHCDAVIQSDPVLLRQILDNLVANAIRYTERGGVVVGCQQSRTVISIEVWDTGIGIPEEQRERVFEDFYQLDNPARDVAKGLGLGLAIVQRTARLLGHTLKVSTQEQGTKFTIEVPLASAAPNEQGDLQAVRTDPASLPKAATILVVDDDAIVRKLTTKILEQCGHRVIAATSGAEAVTKIRETTQPPTILLTDYRLGRGETGLQVIEAVLDALGREIPALIYTGDIQLTDVPEMKDKHFAILQKPVTPEILNKQIQDLLSIKM